MRIIFIKISLIVLGSFITAFAQPSRNIINEGVEKYEEGNFSEAEVQFKKGVNEAPTNYISNFNLGDAFYKQEKYEEAIKSFQTALGDAETDLQKSKVHYNVGNSLLKSQKIKESIEAYKNALKFNPNDEDAKYNLSYALNLLKNQEQQQNQQNQDQNQDQDNDQQKDQQQNQNQEQDEQKNQDQQQQQNPEQKNEESKQDNMRQPQQENKISKEEAERILDALKNNEKELQKKLRQKSGKVRKTDKDW